MQTENKQNNYRKAGVYNNLNSSRTTCDAFWTINVLFMSILLCVLLSSWYVVCIVPIDMQSENYYYTPILFVAEVENSYVTVT